MAHPTRSAYGVALDCCTVYRQTMLERQPGGLLPAQERRGGAYLYSGHFAYQTKTITFPAVPPRSLQAA